MKHAVKTLCLATLMVGLAFGANAQFRQSVFLNGNLPTGNFAGDVNNNWNTPPLTHKQIGKLASAGFGLGYRASYRFDVGVGMVAPFAQADLFWNFMNGTWSDKYTQAKAASAPNYFNIPVMLGVSYLYDQLWNDITPYGEFGVGADMFIITAEKSKTFLHTYAYKPDVKIAWMLGIGAYFGRHVSAGIYYYGLGKHTIQYTNSTYKELNPLEKEAYDNGNVETRTVGSLAIRIGFHF